jgi:predicted aspartyl protease
VIEGKVNANGVPMISLKVAGEVFRAVIDTGFNGDLELPEKLRARVRPRLLGQATCLLAAGVTIQEDVYAVDFTFDGETVEVEAAFANCGELLIGTKLLKSHRLEIDFVARTVRIDRVS